MYNTRSYKASTFYLSLNTAIINLKRSIGDSYKNFESGIAELDRKKNEAAKDPNFHEESYYQNNYNDIDEHEKLNSEIWSHKMSLYQIFITNFKRLVGSSIRKKTSNEAEYAPLFEYVENNMNIDLSSFSDFKEELNEFRLLRNNNTHEGNDLSTSDYNEISALTLEMADKIFNFFCYVLEKNQENRDANRIVRR